MDAVRHLPGYIIHVVMQTGAVVANWLSQVVFKMPQQECDTTNKGEIQDGMGIIINNPYLHWKWY